MIKTCFIGDSHIAALRQATKLDPSIAKGHDLTFFGATGGKMRNVLFVRDGKLTSDDPDVLKSFSFTGGGDGIDLKAYDRFCVVGFSTGMDCIMRMGGRYCPPALSFPNAQPVSDKIYSEVLRYYFGRTITEQVISLLSAHTDKPIAVMPNPNMSETILTDEAGEHYAALLKAGHQAHIRQHYITKRAEFYAGKATVIGQPDATIVHDVLTSKAYTDGSVRLSKKDVAHPETDFGHANAAYGKLALEAYFAAMA